VPKLSFGVVFSNHGGENCAKALDGRMSHEQYAAKIIEADRAGYDFVWIEERRNSSSRSALRDPLAYIADLAPLTEHIRLSACLTTRSLKNLTRLVENISFVDILTKRRLTVGIGSIPHRHGCAGVDVETDRPPVGEILPRMLHLFNTSVECAGTENSGRSYESAAESAVPPQKQHPPLWFGVCSNATLEHAARYGLGIATSMLMLISQLVNLTESFGKMCEQTEQPYSLNPRWGDIDIARFVYVAESDARAKRESADAIVRHLHTVAGTAPSSTASRAATYEDLSADTIIHG
jgi:alkanesulfonate monooxygenase SsuD/methylene tetrahydromethanopterin reductase-like flavin-dependent oxidoreductase (luciferase family)